MPKKLLKREKIYIMPDSQAALKTLMVAILFSRNKPGTVCAINKIPLISFPGHVEQRETKPQTHWPEKEFILLSAVLNLSPAILHRKVPSQKDGFCRR